LMLAVARCQCGSHVVRIVMARLLGIFARWLCDGVALCPGDRRPAQWRPRTVRLLPVHAVWGPASFGPLLWRACPAAPGPASAATVGAVSLCPAAVFGRALFPRRLHARRCTHPAPRSASLERWRASRNVDRALTGWNALRPVGTPLWVPESAKLTDVTAPLAMSRHLEASQTDAAPWTLSTHGRSMEGAAPDVSLFTGGGAPRGISSSPPICRSLARVVRQALP